MKEIFLEGTDKGREEFSSEEISGEKFFWDGNAACVKARVYYSP